MRRRHSSGRAAVWGALALALMCSACTTAPGATDTAALVGDISGDVSGDVSSDAVADALDDTADDATARTEPNPAWLNACLAAAPPNTVLELRWNRFYDGESEERLRRGLFWVFAWLGATLPAANEAAIVELLPGDRLRVHLQYAGFTPRARCLLDRLWQQLAVSGEMKPMGGIDVGRFVALTFASSWHYYAIVDVPPTLQAWQQRHGPLGETAWLEKSLVSSGLRKIERVVTDQPLDFAWLAAEGVGVDGSGGDGSGGDGSGVNYEAFDVMANGELRFAIYGDDGKLRAMADSDHSLGGKPSRCAWCHESLLTPLLTPHELGSAGIDRATFQARIQEGNDALAAFRASMPRLIDHSNVSQHSQGELLYVGFLEPNVLRLVREWALDTDEVVARTVGLPTHHEPYFHVDDALCFDRADLDSVGATSGSPYSAVPTAASAHWDLGDEPNLLK